MPAAHSHGPAARKEIFGWAMYDFANSSFTTAVITVTFGPFFIETIAGGGPSSNTYWSIAIISSTLVALVLAPVLGVMADYSGRKKRMLAWTTAACATATAGLYFIGPGDVWLAIGAITLANAGFMLGESLVAAFLPEIATPKRMAFISGLGWGLGYMGGLACLILLKGVITTTPADPGFVEQNQMAMVVVAIFFAVAAIPTFVLLRDRGVPRPGYEGSTRRWELVKEGFGQLRGAWSLARDNPVLLSFLIAFTFYMAGMEAIIKFVGIYAKGDVGLTEDQMISFFIALQLSAAAGAFGFGYIERFIGPKRTVMATIIWWIIGTMAIYGLDDIAGLLGADPVKVFLGIGLVVGAGIGSIQSSSRAVVGLLSPPERAGEVFGYWGTFMRVAVILGMSFGPLADSLASRRDALLLIVGFFVLGGMLLARVPISRDTSGDGGASRLL